MSCLLALLGHLPACWIDYLPACLLDRLPVGLLGCLVPACWMGCLLDWLAMGFPMALHGVCGSLAVSVIKLASVF